MEAIGQREHVVEEGMGDPGLLQHPAKEGMIALAILHLVVEARIRGPIDGDGVLDPPAGEQG